MALPTSFDNICLPILEIVENKGKGHTTNFTGIYSPFIQKLKLKDAEIEAQIEENVFAVKEILKIGRDGLLGAGWLKGSTSSFEISKSGINLLKYARSNKISDLSELPFELSNSYYDYILEKRKGTITINEIEYTIKGWERKVYKFVEEFNKNPMKQSKLISAHLVKQPLFDNFEGKEITKKTSKGTKELIKELIDNHESSLKKELLEKLKRMDPFHFEEIATNFVCDFIYDKVTPELKKKIAETTKKTGDGGIDGVVVKKDKYGTEKKYFIQAKRWVNTVGSPEIDSFFAALSRKGANDGLFITTSTFSKPARDTIKEFEEIKNVKIIPIDGEVLINMMLEHEIGIKTHNIFKYREIEEGYFNLKK
ncbi:MAG: restriction endonuclease [Spirosomataceae bacterium]